MNPAKKYINCFRDEWLSNDKYKDWTVEREEELSGILQNGSGKQEITGICKELELIQILG